MPRHLEIRLPPLARAWVVGFMSVWCAVVVVAGVRGLTSDPSAGLLVLVLMLGVGMTMGYRMSRLGVVAEGDTLVVRNHWRTHRFPRSEVRDVQEVRVGSGVPWGRAVQVVLADRSAVSLDVTQTAMPWGGHARLQSQLQQLRAWTTSQQPR